MSIGFFPNDSTQNKNTMVLGIDASNIGYGGGMKHLQEFLSNISIYEYGYEKVIIWGDENLEKLPNLDWLEKRQPEMLVNGGFLKKSFWKMFCAKKEMQESCTIVFAPGGAFYSKRIPYISMSRNMLIFEKKEAQRYGLIMQIKFLLLNYVQKKSFKEAKGVIFISEYAKEYITNIVDIKNYRLINHGSSNKFNSKPKKQFSIDKYSFQNPLKILYVSAIRPFKHQKILIKAIAALRTKYPIELTLIGELEDRDEFNKFQSVFNSIDNADLYIKLKDKVSYDEIVSFYNDSQIFAYSSTCENMPNILIEAMAMGLPIACSNYGPMPEFLKDGGEYYDPLNVASIVFAIEKLILNPELRVEYSHKAHEYAQQYSWKKCADETIKYINELI